MTTPTNADTVSYEQFCQEWLAEIEEPNLSPFVKGLPVLLRNRGGGRKDRHDAVSI